MLACSFDTNFNSDYYAPNVPFLEPLGEVPATFRGKMRPLLDPRSFAKFPGKMNKFLRPQAECLVALAFLFCHQIDPYTTCLTLSFNTVYVPVSSH